MNSQHSGSRVPFVAALMAERVHAGTLVGGGGPAAAAGEAAGDTCLMPNLEGRYRRMERDPSARSLVRA
jgi:hypothetical protein